MTITSRLEEDTTSTFKVKVPVGPDIEDEKSNKDEIGGGDTPLKVEESNSCEDWTAPLDPILESAKGNEDNLEGNDHRNKSLRNESSGITEHGVDEDGFSNSKDENQNSDDSPQRAASSSSTCTDDDDCRGEKSCDNDDEKRHMTPLRSGPASNFFPNSAASENDGSHPFPSNGYGYSFPPYHASPPGWSYYPGYYPPYYSAPHLPPHAGHNAGPPPSAYYPPFIPPFPVQHNEGPMAPPPVSSEATQPFPRTVPSSYPYYSGYPPVVPASGGGQQLPMSPLMQQPLFNSPGPSPSTYFSQYNSTSASNKKSGQPFQTPHFGLNTPPYFPPPSDFGKSEADSPPKKSKVALKKSDKSKVNLISNTQSKRKSKRTSDIEEDGPTKQNKRRVTMDGSLPDDSITESRDTRADYSKDDSASVASTSTSVDGNTTNPLGLLTYIKPRQPTNVEELKRRAKKNTHARARANNRKEKVTEILQKAPEDRTEDELNFLSEFENSRGRKNDRSRVRAQENKERVDYILKKPEAMRTRIEIQFLESYLSRKQRKNEGDRLRRERLKMLGLDAKKPIVDNDRPTITARGPLPTELLERVLKKDSDSNLADVSPEKDGNYYGHYGFAQQPPPGYPPYGGYHHPPPYWNDHQALYPPPPMIPSARVDLDGRYHSSFSIFPTDKGPVATSSSTWATPLNATNKKTVVTTDVNQTKEKGTRRGKTRTG